MQAPAGYVPQQQVVYQQAPTVIYTQAAPSNCESDFCLSLSRLLPVLPGHRLCPHPPRVFVCLFAVNGKYYISSYHNKRLSCSDQSVLYASDNFAGWEAWTLTEVSGGRYIITSAHGTFLLFAPLALPFPCLPCSRSLCFVSRVRRHSAVVQRPERPVHEPKQGRLVRACLTLAPVASADVWFWF